MSDFFTEAASRSYDERNSRLSSISQNMHFLTALILKGLPTKSRILCVGVGTGAEIISLSAEYPEWSFVGVDPSESMLDVCRDRMARSGLLDRCALIHGYVQDVPCEESFDAALSILVGHFVKRQERRDFYGGMHRRLKSGGYLVNTEISYDLGSETFPSMLTHWESVQTLMGGTQESLKSLPRQLRDILTVLAPQEVEEVMKESGFALPARFFQAFMITGWYARKGNGI